MNAVEIEQAISELAEQPFDTAEFPYALRMGRSAGWNTEISAMRAGSSVAEVVAVRSHTPHSSSTANSNRSKPKKFKDTSYTPPSEAEPFNKPKSKHLS